MTEVSKSEQERKNLEADVEKVKAAFHSHIAYEKNDLWEAMHRVVHAAFVTQHSDKELRIMLAQLGNLKFNTGQNADCIPRAKEFLFENLDRLIEILSDAASLYGAQPAFEGWRTIETAPAEGGFHAWCRWYLVPRNPKSDAPPRWTDWMARHSWQGPRGLQGSGDDLYRVDKVEATHWRPLPPGPITDCESCEGTGRIECYPEEDARWSPDITHPCDDCNEAAHEEWKRGYDVGHAEAPTAPVAGDLGDRISRVRNWVGEIIPLRQDLECLIQAATSQQATSEAEFNRRLAACIITETKSLREHIDGLDKEIEELHSQKARECSTQDEVEKIIRDAYHTVYDRTSGEIGHEIYNALAAQGVIKIKGET